MHSVIQAVGLVLDPQVLLTVVLASLFGLFVGAVPGLTATMATALLVPITFFMDPLPAVAAIVACTAMAITAGDIPGCLLRIPGTPASAAYTDETFAMTKRGLGAQALGASLVSSVIGGIVGTVVLILAAPALARIALQFSSFEYFWLALIGLSCAAFVSSDDPVRGFVSLLIGLFIASVGMDGVSGTPRFTLGVTELLGGISFIPAMIGMFAVSEILNSLVRGTARERFAATQKVTGVFRGILGLIRHYWRNVARGSVTGTLIGVLPGAGGDIAAWISYATAKRFSKTPEKFGTGHPEGVIEAGAANNGGLSGAWVPALVFGIPGDAVTAIAVGVLFMKGLNPGPRLFEAQAEMLYAVFIIFLIANLLLLPFGWAAIRLASRILTVPRPQLMAIILLFCVVGSFAINNTVFDIGLMLGFGILAFLLSLAGFPVAPIILGIVLGPLLEQNFLTSMVIAGGDITGFFERPVAAALGVAAILIWAVPLGLAGLRLLRGCTRAAKPAENNS
ncbi:C4-dicarboxylate ABC transporter permease [Chelatococcus sp. CO-6]|uniref:tripartite tricarboxylate transporter permease n=1 Tax=Chelatococcus sp. CO-6 TaxID=1702325 RepID=UPI00069CCB8A|nr:tripartite tricarboxylate transporter permease [Chelatococcus sp. CO-6]ALA17895.1 C4-dicarboxylate ABC transporter permease [Chelatococcus sp. CO-6]